MEAYESDLEKPLLANTARFYAQRSAQWIQEDTCPEYMLKVDQCLDKEKQRVAAYLHATSEQKLLKEVENALLQAHQMTLLEKEHTGCMALLRDDKKDDLKRMFELFSRIPKGLDPIAAFFKQHITERGNALVKAAEEAMANKGAGGSRKADGEGSSAEQTFMRDVIQLHDDYLAYVMNQFGKHTQFHRALKEAFESFCNKTVSGSTFAELLASFCDNLLKKCSAEKLTDDAVEETLDKVVKLLAYISDKDLFAEFYRKRLARRLLFDRSANDDAEKSILTKLKQQCGSTFTSKLEGMVTDMALAKDFQQKFAQWAEERRPKVEISVNVLTTGFWPTYKFVELTLPREMVEARAPPRLLPRQSQAAGAAPPQRVTVAPNGPLRPASAAHSNAPAAAAAPPLFRQGVELFKEFYELQAKHRKLTWIYALGTVQLAAKFDPKPMELILSPFQARGEEGLFCARARGGRQPGEALCFFGAGLTAEFRAPCAPRLGRRRCCSCTTRRRPSPGERSRRRSRCRCAAAGPAPRVPDSGSAVPHPAFVSRVLIPPPAPSTPPPRPAGRGRDARAAQPRVRQVHDPQQVSRGEEHLPVGLVLRQLVVHRQDAAHQGAPPAGGREEEGDGGRRQGPQVHHRRRHRPLDEVPQGGAAPAARHGGVEPAEALPAGLQGALCPKAARVCFARCVRVSPGPWGAACVCGGSGGGG